MENRKIKFLLIANSYVRNDNNNYIGLFMDGRSLVDNQKALLNFYLPNINTEFDNFAFYNFEDATNIINRQVIININEYKKISYYQNYTVDDFFNITYIVSTSDYNTFGKYWFVSEVEFIGLNQIRYHLRLDTITSYLFDLTNYQQTSVYFERLHQDRYFFTNLYHIEFKFLTDTGIALDVRGNFLKVNDGEYSTQSNDGLNGELTSAVAIKQSNLPVNFIIMKNLGFTIDNNLGFTFILHSVSSLNYGDFSESTAITLLFNIYEINGNILRTPANVTIFNDGKASNNTTLNIRIGIQILRNEETKRIFSELEDDNIHNIHINAGAENIEYDNASIAGKYFYPKYDYSNINNGIFLIDELETKLNNLIDKEVLTTMLPNAKDTTQMVNYNLGTNSPLYAYAFVKNSNANSHITYNFGNLFETCIAIAPITLEGTTFNTYSIINSYYSDQILGIGFLDIPLINTTNDPNLVDLTVTGGLKTGYEGRKGATNDDSWNNGNFIVKVLSDTQNINNQGDESIDLMLSEVLNNLIPTIDKFRIDEFLYTLEPKIYMATNTEINVSKYNDEGKPLYLELLIGYLNMDEIISNLDTVEEIYFNATYSFTPNLTTKMLTVNTGMYKRALNNYHHSFQYSKSLSLPYYINQTAGFYQNQLNSYNTALKSQKVGLGLKLGLGSLGLIAGAATGGLAGIGLLGAGGSLLGGGIGGAFGLQQTENRTKDLQRGAGSVQNSQNNDTQFLAAINKNLTNITVRQLPDSQLYQLSYHFHLNGYLYNNYLEIENISDLKTRERFNYIKSNNFIKSFIKLPIEVRNDINEKINNGIRIFWIKDTIENINNFNVRNLEINLLPHLNE